MKIEKCYVNYLGCEKRKLDTQRIYDFFKANNYCVTFDVKQADAIVFVTCAFCEKYEDWSIAKMEKIYRKKKKEALFIICGCLTSINPKRLMEHFPDATLIQTRKLEEIENIFPHTISIKEIPDPNTTIFDQRIAGYESERLKTDAQLQYEEAKKGFKIRINWGCLGNCSFCVTRYAELKLKSKPLADVVQEFRHGLDQKETCFFFTGGDTGAYGQDIGLNIIDLFKSIFAFEGKFIVHFHDFGVHWFIRYAKEIKELFAKNRDRLGCFSLPIQSGSNKILKLMHRPYQIETVLDVLNDIYKEVPELKIGSHFITGFPGETEEDFQQSMIAVEKLPLAFCNVFPYTDHASSESYSFPDKVPVDIILNRYQILFDKFAQKSKK